MNQYILFGWRSSVINWNLLRTAFDLNDYLSRLSVFSITSCDVSVFPKRKLKTINSACFSCITVFSHIRIVLVHMFNCILHEGNFVRVRCVSSTEKSILLMHVYHHDSSNWIENHPYRARKIGNLFIYGWFQVGTWSESIRQVQQKKRHQLQRKPKQGKMVPRQQRQRQQRQRKRKVISPQSYSTFSMFGECVEGDVCETVYTIT